MIRRIIYILQFLFSFHCSAAMVSTMLLNGILHFFDDFDWCLSKLTKARKKASESDGCDWDGFESLLCGLMYDCLYVLVSVESYTFLVIVVF